MLRYLLKKEQTNGRVQFFFHTHFTYEERKKEILKSMIGSERKRHNREKKETFSDPKREEKKKTSS